MLLRDSLGYRLLIREQTSGELLGVSGGNSCLYRTLYYGLGSTGQPAPLGEVAEGT